MLPKISINGMSVAVVIRKSLSSIADTFFSKRKEQNVDKMNEKQKCPYPNCDGKGIRHCVLKNCPNYRNEINNATYDQERTVSQILNEKRDNVLKNSPSNLNEENISVN